MRKELEKIYENIFLDYAFESRDYFQRNRYFIEDEEYSIIRIIRRELQRADDKFLDNVILRPDAKLFTLIIFHQLVSAPLLYERNNVNYTVLESAIEKDIRDLMQLAFEEKRNAEINEVTAHTILSLIDKRWNLLNISKNEWWNT